MSQLLMQVVHVQNTPVLTRPHMSNLPPFCDVCCQLCVPCNSEALKWHPVTPAMSKPSYDHPDASRDVRTKKGSIGTFFKPAAASPAGGSSKATVKEEQPAAAAAAVGPAKAQQQQHDVLKQSSSPAAKDAHHHQPHQQQQQQQQKKSPAAKKGSISSFFKPAACSPAEKGAEKQLQQQQQQLEVGTGKALSATGHWFVLALQAIRCLQLACCIKHQWLLPKQAEAHQFINQLSTRFCHSTASHMPCVIGLFLLPCCSSQRR
jgi:hypothetical protein